jgi:hypothetical protein
MVNRLPEIYGYPDNLRSFLHPKYKKHFNFVSYKELGVLAKKIGRKIVLSDYNQVLVVESGASPFANLCKKMIGNKKKIDWKFIKFPRDSVKNIFPVFDYYLSKRERNERLTNERINQIKIILSLKEIKNKTREKVLKEVCRIIPKEFLSAKKLPLKIILKNINIKEQSKYQKAVSIIFEGTKINKFLKKPFLFFDEYIDSGTTLNDYHHYLNFIAKTNFEIISYQIMVNNSKDISQLHYTLYDLDSQLKCYNSGVYPFENRIDLIGYFYFYNEEEVSLEEFKFKINEAKSNNFISALENWISKEELVKKTKKRFKIKDLGKFIDENHLLRYCLFVFENENKSNTRNSEFLWLSSDMYGPIWSPLPDAYHFEFMKVLGEVYSLMKKSPDFHNIFAEYIKVRKSVLGAISKNFIKNKEKWLNNMNHLIN